MAIANLVNAATIDDAFLFLLTIQDDSDPAKPVVLRAVNNLEDVVSNGETYTAFPFDVILPNDQGQRPQTLTLAAPNVGRELIQVLRQNLTPPTVKLDLVLSSDPDQIQKTIDFLTVSGATYTSEMVEFSLVTSGIFQRKTISSTYHPSEFKALFWGNS